MIPRRLQAEYAAVLDDVALLATRDAVDLWRLTPSDPKATAAMLTAAGPAITDTYGTVAASLAVDFYQDSRTAANAKGRYVPTPTEPAPPGTVEALARWSVGPLFSAEPDPVLALSLFAAGIERLVRQPFRQTVISNSGADPEAKGVRRSTSSGACQFCTQLASEMMFVSAAGESAADHWHTHCKCSAGPEF